MPTAASKSSQYQAKICVPKSSSKIAPAETSVSAKANCSTANTMNRRWRADSTNTLTAFAWELPLVDNLFPSPSCRDYPIYCATRLKQWRAAFSRGRFFLFNQVQLSLQRQKRTQRYQIKRGQHNRQPKTIHRHRRPNRARAPNTGRGSGALYG